MIYFRVIHAKRPEGFELCYADATTNIWLEWLGLADVVAKRKQEQHATVSTAGAAGEAKL